MANSKALRLYRRRLAGCRYSWSSARNIRRPCGWIFRWNRVENRTLKHGLGTALGFAMGSAETAELGAALGTEDGSALGTAEDFAVGSELGSAVGPAVGNELGNAVGHEVGSTVGAAVGSVTGILVIQHSVLWKAPLWAAQSDAPLGHWKELHLGRQMDQH
jgi:hypothetical protein